MTSSWTILAALSLWAGAPAQELTSPEAIKLAISRLTTEAEQGRAAGELPRLNADFAAGFPHLVSKMAVGVKITLRMHADPFVDAYVRWQLTSFDAALPLLNDRKFQRMLGELPPYLDHPRADARLIALMQRLRQGGDLDDADRTAASRHLDRLAKAESRARQLNLPARKLR